MAETDKTPSTAPGIRVFVYGTLKQGRSNANALRGAEFLGRCRLTEGHKLVDLGFYPGLVMDPAPNAPSMLATADTPMISRS